jgi:heptosyltransferase III
VERILIMRGGALGDFIVTLPACRLIREKWPKAHITYLGNPRFGALGVERFYFDEVGTLEGMGMARLFTKGDEMDAKWQEFFAGFQLIISYLYDPEEYFHQKLAACTKAQVVRGTPQVVIAPAARHFMEPLAVLGLASNNYESEIQTLEDEMEPTMELVAGIGRKVLAFHPGSGSPRKNWPVEKWRVFLDLAQAQGFSLFMVLGEAERDRRVELRGLSQRVAEGWELPHLAAVLSQCAAFVGNDSGIAHLAAAVGTRTLTFFGPSESVFWAPQGQHVRVLEGGPDWEGFTPEQAMQTLADLCQWRG